MSHTENHKKAGHPAFKLLIDQRDRQKVWSLDARPKL
ncbi:MAG: hypothetical protein ACI9NC_006033, partial [Verrucomicrobiales bacterium]